MQSRVDLSPAEKKMAEIRNIGPACAKDLVAAGIDSYEKLKKLGAKEAFIALCLQQKKFCFNACYLYALQGAIDDIPWNAIPEEQKAEFKAFTAQLRADMMPR